MAGNVKLFALSTCGHCRNTKKWLSENNIDCDIVDVDTLRGEERKAVIEEMKQFNPRLTFPTLVLADESIIVGYHPERFEEAFKDG